MMGNAPKKLRHYLLENGDVIREDKVTDARLGKNGEIIAKYNKYLDGDARKAVMIVYCKVVKELTDAELARYA